jgi:hypothetical protein
VLVDLLVTLVPPEDAEPAAGARKPSPVGSAAS